MTYKEANNISIKDYLNSWESSQPRKREAWMYRSSLTGGQHAKFQGGL